VAKTMARIMLEVVISVIEYDRRLAASIRGIPNEKSPPRRGRAWLTVYSDFLQKYQSVHS
jgi:hypothetical protein